MLLKAGGVKILDFGIAKAAALARRQDTAGKTPRLAGKLAYLSPELVRGTPIDHRSDIFSLGVVLWEMVAGQRLFAGETDSDTLHNVLMQPIAEPSRRRDGIPAVLDAIVARALERDPDQPPRNRRAVRQRARSLPGRDADGRSGDPAAARGAVQRRAAAQARRADREPVARPTSRTAATPTPARRSGRAAASAIAPSRRRSRPGCRCSR